MTVTVAGKEYTATTAISGHALAKKTGKEVKVKLSYDSNGELADGEFAVAFGDVTLVYSSIDDSTFVPPITGGGGNGTALASIVSQNAVSDSNTNFGSSEGLDVENNAAYIVNGTENDTNPIYYYHVNVKKNNIIFANFCWKIVRTTETGGTKLIYNGVPAVDGSCNNTGEASHIGKSQFNTNDTSEDDTRYIFADGTDSTIKAYIDDWYEANMTTYTSQLEDTVWCNDRSVFSYNDFFWETEFGACGRLCYKPYKPSLECGLEYQLTVASTDIDKHLTYPVALLTADEIAFAGTSLKAYSTSSYLYTNDTQWTLSPIDILSGYTARGFAVYSTGRLDIGPMTVSYGVRPSISLKPGTQITGTGDGSVQKPYIVE